MVSSGMSATSRANQAGSSESEVVVAGEVVVAEEVVVVEEVLSEGDGSDSKTGIFPTPKKIRVG